MSRPTVLDDLVSRRICDAVAKGNTRETAANAARISTSTLYAWVKRGKKGESGYVEFLACLKAADAEAEGEAVAIVRAAALKGTWQAAAWWLERRKPARWALRRVEPVERQTNAEKFKNMSGEELRARWKEITGHDYDDRGEVAV